jgi:two-component system, LytTR family, sensor kinase
MNRANGETARMPSITFWQAQIGGWVAFYAIFQLASLPERSGTQLFHNTVWCALMFISSTSLHPLCQRILRQKPSWLVSVACIVCACLVLSAAAAAIIVVVTWDSNPKVLGFLTFECTVTLIFWCLLYFSVKQWQQFATEQARLLQVEHDAREAKLAALRYQLNPHFLFNALNAVSTLILAGKAPEANRMLSRVSSLLRTTLDCDTMAEIPLSREIELVEQYLAIENVRFGRLMHVEISTAPETPCALVPAMLLQPLVENAVRHGIAQQLAPGFVSIESTADNNRLRLRVRNSGPPTVISAVSRSGVGIANTTERLRTLYGSDCDIHFSWPTEGGCEVTLDLPLRRSEETPGACESLL